MLLQDFSKVNLLDDIEFFADAIALGEGRGITNTEVGEAGGDSHGDNDFVAAWSCT